MHPVRAQRCSKTLLRDKTGFTLIEILIVVLLLGIIGTIMIDQLSTSAAPSGSITFNTTVPTPEAVVILTGQRCQATPRPKRPSSRN